MKRLRLSFLAPAAMASWALLFCGLSSSARALVGETNAQIEARYGGPGKMIGNQVLYTKDHWNISVFYNGDGIVTMEIYTHHPDAGGARPDITPSEIDALLQDQGRGRSWGVGEADGLTTWRRDDGRLFARYRPADQLIVFLSPDHQALIGRAPVVLKEGKEGKEGDDAPAPAPANP